MALANQQLVVGDFSGGITDYTLDADPNQSAELENFVINKNKKLESVPGSTIYDEDFPQIPDGNARICGMFKSLDPNLYVNSARKIWYPGSSSWTELTGPTSNPAISTGTTSSFISTAEWNGHTYVANSDYSTPIKIYKDGSTTKVRTAGLPDLASTPTCTSGGGSGNNYNYAFHYFYQYTVGTTLFEDYGPVTYVQKTNIGAPNVNNVAIAAIPTLANGATLNYDTTVIKVYIYRTANNGLTYYKIGEVTNGTAVFTDNFADSSITSNLLLYTNGGTLDYDPPPLCKFVHIVNGLAYWANIKEGTEYFTNQIRQSIPGDPDSCPAALTVDLLEEIVGISSFNDNPIVFTKKRAVRLNGTYDELGQGQVTFEDITKTVGCMSHNSIVQTRFGVFWAGDDGFYWTDGFNFKKISDSINERYKQIVLDSTRQSRIYAAYDTTDNKIHWAVTYGSASTDNDYFFTLDLRYGITDASTFTTRQNGSSFAPTAIIYYQGNLIRADKRGYVFTHSTSYLTDPKVDTNAAYSTWTTKGIVPLYKSTIFNFGLPMVRKWVPKILLSMQNITNVSVQISGINDNSSFVNDLTEIRYRGNILWGDPDPLWGADTPYWSYFNLIEEMRRFPARSLRCSFKQIQITQSYSIIYNSDSYGTATVDSSTKTATITGVFPTDIVDYYISFITDGYDKQYQITARNSDTVLTYLDPGTEQTSGSGVKWLIKGYPKSEVFDINSYVLYYAPLTDQSYKTYRTEQDSTGANA
jgi:hypothetical protein